MMPITNQPQIEVQELSVEYPGGFRALRNISLAISAGETLGIVGESGCGKSTLGGAFMGDVPGDGRITSGKTLLHGAHDTHDTVVNLVTAAPAQRRALWGRRLAMVYQNPSAALNPGYTIGNQIDEAVRRRPGLPSATVRERTFDLLEHVHLPNPQQIARRYPHQLSGGQQQRVVIAMALAANPDVLIMDEPTTGLDVTTEARILDLVLELKQTVNAAIVFITHNLAVIAQISDRVGVMYAGQLIELGPVKEIFNNPSAPYTAGLLSCIPRIDRQHRAHHALRTIPGTVPAPTERLPGCSFLPRCPFAQERCRREAPQLLPTPEARHTARCFFLEDVRAAGWPADGKLNISSAASAKQRQPILRGERLGKTYGHDLRKYWFTGPVVQRAVVALNEMSFQLHPGETLGIVGESGCGKTTLVNCISGLTPMTHGTLTLGREQLARHLKQRPRTALRRMQMVFQNPERSLNPKHTVAEILERALHTFQSLKKEEGTQSRKNRVLELLEQVGLSAHYLTRRPSELSGGEKQRVAIARALAGKPDVMLADEVTSALDVSVRASVLNLLNELQVRQGIAYLFISHDMSAIRYVSDRVMVLYLGMLMEIGPVERVFTPPFHPYTEALMSAIPAPDPERRHTPIRLEGRVPGAVQRPTGCPFHPRCPRKIGPVCEHAAPPRREAAENHRIYCHLPLQI